MQEIWIDVENYEGLYKISNFGRLKRFYKNRPEKIIKPILGSFGYMFYSLAKNAKTKTYRIHRLVAKYFISNPNNYLEVNHIDGDKSNNHVSNLEWCTRSYNIQHSYNSGLRFVSDKHKKILSESAKNRIGGNNNNSKKVINILTNEIFNTVKEAALSINMNPGTLRAMLSNRNPNKTNFKKII